LVAHQRNFSHISFLYRLVRSFVGCALVLDFLSALRTLSRSFSFPAAHGLFIVLHLTVFCAHIVRSRTFSRWFTALPRGSSFAVRSVYSLGPLLVRTAQQLFCSLHTLCAVYGSPFCARGSASFISFPHTRARLFRILPRSKRARTL